MCFFVIQNDTEPLTLHICTQNNSIRWIKKIAHQTRQNPLGQVLVQRVNLTSLQHELSIILKLNLYREREKEKGHVISTLVLLFETYQNSPTHYYKMKATQTLRPPKLKRVCNQHIR